MNYPQGDFERQLVELGLVSSRRSAGEVAQFVRKNLRGRDDDDFVALLSSMRRLGAVRDDRTARAILLHAQKWLGWKDGTTNQLGYVRHTKLADKLGLTTVSIAKLREMRGLALEMRSVLDE